MTRSPSFLAAVLPVVVVACAASSEDAGTSESATTSGWSPYPDVVRPMQVHEPLTPQNAAIDFGDVVRDQGAIASCASHSFAALLENELFLKRGVAIDLSERYQLFANFLETGNMGNQPEVIARYASIVERLGVMPEELYPYADVVKNAVRFEADAAQGLQTDANAVTVDKAIEGTVDATKARSDVLLRPEYLGALPKGPYPVVIPVRAKLLPDARVPEVEAAGKIASCFSERGAAAEREDRRIAMTPREFAHYCLGIDPKPYFTCQAPALDDTLKAVAATTPEPADGDCAGARALFDKVGKTDADRRDALLALTMSLLERGQAVVVGVQAPGQAMQASVWPTVLPAGSGHAVLALGYVTADELASPAEQTRGMLGRGLFEKLATKIEPAYAEKVAAGLPTDPAALRDARLASKLGKLATAEGGLLFFRNSWGAKVGDVEIGAEGYQSMTFAYFARSFLLLESRAAGTVPGVTWATTASACPSKIDVTGSGAWFSRADKGKTLADQLWSQGKPAACTP